MGFDYYLFLCICLSCTTYLCETLHEIYLLFFHKLPPLSLYSF